MSKRRQTTRQTRQQAHPHRNPDCDDSLHLTPIISPSESMTKIFAVSRPRREIQNP
jgi:hypothetical protein